MWSGAGYRVRSSKRGGRTCLGAHTWKLFKIDQEDFLASEVCVKCHRTRCRGLKADDPSKLSAVAVIDSANVKKSHLKRELNFRLAERTPESRQRIKGIVAEISQLNRDIGATKQILEPIQVVGLLITFFVFFVILVWTFS